MSRSVKSRFGSPLKDYTLLPNHLIDNRKLLSPTTLAIVWYLMRKGDDWEVQFQNIQNEFDIGLRLVRQAFKELEALGYAKLISLPRGDKGGWNGKRWQLEVDIEPPIAPIHFGTVRGCIDVQGSSDAQESCNPDMILSPNGDVSVNREDGLSTTLRSKISKPSKQPPGPKAKAPGRGMKSSACSKEQYVPKYSPDNKLLKRSSVNWPSKEWFEQFSSEYGMMEDPDDLASVLHGLIKRDGKITNCESVLRGHYAERLRCALLNNQR